MRPVVRYSLDKSDNDPYTDDELMEWLPKIRQLDEEAPLTLVYMNNHWQGQAAGTARQLRMLMEGDGELLKLEEISFASIQWEMAGQIRLSSHREGGEEWTSDLPVEQP
jgi:hypothetical protein